MRDPSNDSYVAWLLGLGFGVQASGLSTDLDFSFKRPNKKRKAKFWDFQRRAPRIGRTHSGLRMQRDLGLELIRRESL